MSDELIPKPYNNPLFPSLVFNEAGEPAEVAFIGQEAFYVVLDDDFRRHVEAKSVDAQVLSWLQAQVNANKDLVTEGMLSMLGKDDLFTKAMIDSSIKNMDQVLDRGIPPDARMWLGMLGFRIVVNVHGEVINIEMPNAEEGLEGFGFGGL